jgi:hypothetical protein
VKKMHGDTRAMGRGADGMPKRNTRWYLLFERQGGRKGAAVVQLNPNAYWRMGENASDHVSGNSLHRDSGWASRWK